MMALMQGLTLPIMNPNSEGMMGALRAYRLLTNLDKNAVDYILHQAIEQVEAGADILDVNVGLPGIDET